ncbi:hypothetical protein GINT2_000786 [Glugoides intestinalis]
MKFTTEGESVIKEFFNAKNKEEIILRIDDKVNTLTSELKEIIGTEYSALVDACEVLDTLWDKINELKIVNTETEKMAHSILVGLKESKGVESDLEQAFERICAVQKELIRLEKLLELKKETENDLKRLKIGRKKEYVEVDENMYFRIVSNVIKMEGQVTFYEKYYFFGVLVEEINNIKDEFEEIITDNINEFLELDWVSIGREVKVSKGFKIFDEIKAEEKKICTKKVQDTIYSFKKFSYMIPKIVKTINNYRKKIFDTLGEESKPDDKGKAGERKKGDESKKPGERKNGDEDLLCFYIGNMLLSDLLSRNFKSIESFYDIIFIGLSKIQGCSNELVAKVRIIAEKLKISSIELDRAIEMLIYNHFETGFKPAVFMTLTKEEITERIQKSLEFLETINSYENEFDEILAKRIDNSFIYMLNNTPFENFFTRVEETKEIFSSLIHNKNELFQKYPFAFIEEMQNSILKLAERKVEEIRIFSVKGTTKEIVKKILHLKETKCIELKKQILLLIVNGAEEIFEGKSSDDKILFIDTAQRNLN